MWLEYFISEQYVQKYAGMCILKLPIKTISVMGVHIIRWRSSISRFISGEMEMSGSQES